MSKPCEAPYWYETSGDQNEISSNLWPEMVESVIEEYMDLLSDDERGGENWNTSILAYMLGITHTAQGKRTKSRKQKQMTSSLFDAIKDAATGGGFLASKEINDDTLERWMTTCFLENKKQYSDYSYKIKALEEKTKKKSFHCNWIDYNIGGLTGGNPRTFDSWLMRHVVNSNHLHRGGPELLNKVLGFVQDADWEGLQKYKGNRRWGVVREELTSTKKAKKATKVTKATKTTKANATFEDFFEKYKDKEKIKLDERFFKNKLLEELEKKHKDNTGIDTTAWMAVYEIITSETCYAESIFDLDGINQIMGEIAKVRTVCIIVFVIVVFFSTNNYHNYTRQYLTFNTY